MARRLVDISSPLKAGINSDPPHMLPQIEYLDHHPTAPAMAEYMGVRVDQLPDGEYAAVEKVAISTHNGTHLDAPYHFFSTHEPRAEAGRGAVLADRRRAAGMVLPARGEAGFPPPAGRLCGDAGRRGGGTEAHRPHAAAAGDRRGQHRGRGAIRRGRLRRFRVRHGQGGDDVAAGTRRARWSAPMPGAGMRRSRSRASRWRKPAMPA